jgi:pimeloyl-ACP methyl ester carboxylesterase
VKVHASVLWGDPDEPVVFALPGLSTDAIHMWAACVQRARSLGAKGHFLFFDPPGVGFSQTPDDPEAHTPRETFRAFVGSMQEIGRTRSADLFARTPVFLVQSLGYEVPMYALSTGFFPTTVQEPYGTSPGQRGLLISNPVVKGRSVFDGESLGERAVTAPFIPFGRGDFINGLYFILQPGVPYPFARGWKTGFDATASSIDGEPVDFERSAWYILRSVASRQDGDLSYMSMGLHVLPHLMEGRHRVISFGGGIDTGTTPRAVASHVGDLAGNPVFDAEFRLIKGMSHFQIGKNEQGVLADVLVNEAIPAAKRMDRERGF